MIQCLRPATSQRWFVVQDTANEIAHTRRDCTFLVDLRVLTLHFFVKIHILLQELCSFVTESYSWPLGSSGEMVTVLKGGCLMLSYLLPGSNQIPGRSPFSLQGYVPFGWKPTEEALRCDLVVEMSISRISTLLNTDKLSFAAILALTVLNQHS